MVNVADILGKRDREGPEVYVCCTEGPARRSKISKAGNFGDAIRNVCGGCI